MLQQEIYVDDVLSGEHTLTEAKLKLSQLKNALLSAAFSLQNITAIHKSLLEQARSRLWAFGETRQPIASIIS